MILTPLQKLPKNGEDWGKLIVAKGFKKLPKVQKIAKSGQLVLNQQLCQASCIVVSAPCKISTFAFVSPWL